MVMNRRVHRRYPLTFPVDVTIGIDGQQRPFATECIELSAEGMTLSCDAIVIDALRLQAHYPRTCTLGFALPDRPGPFKIDCHVVRHRRLSRSHFHLVALFRHYRLGNPASLTDALANLGHTLDRRDPIARQARG